MSVTIHDVSEVPAFRAGRLTASCGEVLGSESRGGRPANIGPDPCDTTLVWFSGYIDIYGLRCVSGRGAKRLGWYVTSSVAAVEASFFEFRTLVRWRSELLAL